MIEKLTEEIIEGRRLNKEDDFQLLLHEDLSQICKGADRLRKHFLGNEAELCSIINGRSGRCSEDCKFCAQSSHYSTKIKEYPFLEPEKILEDCKRHEEKNVGRYSIVTAVRKLGGEEMEKALEAYRAMAKSCPGIGLCASFGLLEENDFVRLREAGVTRYHANIETSRRNFPNICTTHTFEQKLEVIRRAKRAGLKVCSGGIIGMGETWEDRIDMALTLSTFQVESVPLNVLRPIKGTPFGYLPVLKEEDILRTVGIFRYINPDKEIRLAAGRNSMSSGGMKVFCAGANGAITGDMLTTGGNKIDQDRQELAAMGFIL